MRRDNLRTIGYLLVFIALAMLVIFFDDIEAMINQAMAEQTQSLMDQLLR